MENDIVQIISNIGFPIVAFYLMYKQNNDVLEKVRDIISKNTVVIEKLSVKLEKMEREEMTDEIE